MKEELHKLMEKKQQLQQELLAASTRLEDSQQQLQQQVSDITIPSWGRLAYSWFLQKKKDAQALSLETLGIEKRDTSGGGEDPALIQLAADDGECVLLYTVNTTHCTHYCDSDTCLWCESES